MTLRNKLHWNLNRNRPTKLFIHENALENVACEMTAIFSRGLEWVKGIGFDRQQLSKLLSRVTAKPKLVLYIDSETLNIWWRHLLETFSALLALCAGTSAVTKNSPHKGQWRGAVMFSLICAWTNGWVNASDFRRHRGHYDVTLTNITMATYNVMRLFFI